ncbi:hypothetical protein F5878DRAFT_614980 [Lentinula raphanica]|uniref:Uncharacterized protein n=1 Tax=Lentinula raphanica TaxID=153919 RepID=A0AA38UFH1_9AGAR|nr:hypothetical protein F5878DRAFT_614980 [Lentinula raphanica]
MSPLSLSSLSGGSKLSKGRGCVRAGWTDTEVSKMSVKVLPTIHNIGPRLGLPMDINDSAGIKALLEQLESSSAWQDTIGSSTSPPDDHLQHAVHPSQSLPAPQLSVSELLSQLQPEHNQMAVDPQDSAIGIRTHTPQSSASVKSSVNHDRTFEGYRSSTFQQALSLIASVSDNPSFGDSLKSMKKEQDDLETKLSNERKAILSKYEAKVQVAKTKASIISTGLSKHEANVCFDASGKITMCHLPGTFPRAQVQLPDHFSSNFYPIYVVLNRYSDCMAKVTYPCNRAKITLGRNFLTRSFCMVFGGFSLQISK